MQGAWVCSLIGELRSHMPHSVAKKKKKQTEWIVPSNEKEQTITWMSLKCIVMGEKTCTRKYAYRMIPFKKKL